MSDKVLEVKDLHFYYGEIHALKGISLDVSDGEIVTLIGANGAGKTTTLRSISGLLGHIASGEVRFMGERIDNQKGYAIAAKGLAQCLEGRHVFSNLTVKENLQMGCYPVCWSVRISVPAPCPAASSRCWRLAAH